MVTRKTSLPYPASPPQANPRSTPFVAASNNHAVDSTDLPPIPHPPRDSDEPRRDSGFADNDNPWSDHYAPPQAPVPRLSEPHGGQTAVQGNARVHSLADIPSVLRPGNSGQDTPRSSIDSGESRGFWEDEGDVDNEHSPVRSSPSKAKADHEGQYSPPAIPQSLPSASAAIRRKPVASPPSLQHELPSHDSSHDFASNNPFRRPSSSASNPPEPSRAPPSLPTWDFEDTASRVKGKQPVREEPVEPLNIDLSRLDVQENHSAYQASQPGEDPWRPLEPTLAPPPPRAAPPPIPGEASSPFSSQPPLIPVATENQLQNPWTSQRPIAPTPSPIPFDESQKYLTHYNSSMLDRGQETGVVSLGGELQAVPNASHAPTHLSQRSLLDDDALGPPLPTRPEPRLIDDQQYYAPSEGPPPQKPARPNVSTKTLSAKEIAQIAEDRNETYQIKHFNWFDHGSGRLRRSSMLTQNNNGPCPLLALVNALILGATDESQAALDDALRSREQVSLGLIIETLMYELVARNADSGEQLPDVDELNAFLMRLRTGMNANPRFVSSMTAPPNLMDARNSVLHLPQQERNKHKTGTFEATLDMRLYGAFSVPLLHGWLPDPRSDANEAFRRSAQTYEDAQALQFGEEELEYKLSHGGLTPEEQYMWEDINSIKTFLRQFPTQLTPYGMSTVQDALSSGSFAIMFRNDHFSTIYKHPQSGQLFTLITDAGYADRDEIIWESLVDIAGSNNEFFSGDFMPLSHSETQPSNNNPPLINRQQHLTVPDGSNAPFSAQEQQEQHDADFAMALQLQEEEEQRQRVENARRRRPGQGSQSNPRDSPRSSQGTIPIQLRPVNSRSDAPENRPLIPPRNARTQVQAVNRPADALDDDAPPAYEEAAKGKPYVPPLGSPLHPSSDTGASPMSSNVQLTGTVSNVSVPGTISQPGPSAPSYVGPSGPMAGRGTGRPGQPVRSMSAHYEQASTSMGMPGGFNWGESRQIGRFGPGHYPPGRRGPGQDKDCIVM